MTNASDALLRSEINRLLMESGELERLETLLLDLLRESGWYEATKQLCAEKMRKGEFKSNDFSSVAEEVEKLCRDQVPEAVKVETVKAIKKALEEVVE